MRNLGRLMSGIFNKLSVLISLVVVLSAVSSQAFSAVHFTLKGSSSSSNLGLQSQSTTTGSASASIDIGVYFRLGLTHRQDVSAQKGYSQDGSTNNYYYSQTTTRLAANSVDFTVILYYGELWVPYIMTGLIKKEYLIESPLASGGTATSRYSLPPVPNAGFGVGFRINRNFSLKLSYTVSPGVTQPTPSSEVRSTLDKVTSVGITYNL
jgi:hypothetical protein